MTLTAASVALTFFTTILLGRVLGPADFGSYSLALTTVMLLASLSYTGLGVLIVRESAVAAARDLGRLRQVVRAGYVTALAMSLVIVGALAIGITALADIWTWERRATFGWAGLLVPVLALVTVQSSVLRGLGRPIAGQVSEVIVRPFVFATLLVLWLAAGLEALGPANAMALHAGAGLGCLLVSIGVYRALGPKHNRISALPDSVGSWGRWGNSLSMFSVVYGVSALGNSIDLLVLGLLTNDATAGIYRVVGQFALIAPLAIATISGILQPQIAELYASDQRAELQRRITHASRIAFAIALGAFAVFSLSGNTLISLAFGHAFAGGGTALAITAAGQLSYGVFGPAIHVLNMTGHERDTAQGLALAAATTLIGSFALIPFLGLNGAALASAAGLVSGQFYLTRKVRARTGLECSAFFKLQKSASMFVPTVSSVQRKLPNDV
ncbi:MAG: oligosaccharide flippase family protein [Hyphomicrobiaceae bacterium]